MTQHEKLSAAQMDRIRATVQPSPPCDLELRIAERDAIDRKAEFISRLALILLAFAGLATVGVAVWAVMR